MHPKILSLSQMLIGLSKVILSPYSLSLTYPSPTKPAIAQQNSNTIIELEMQSWQRIYRLSHF